MIRVWTDEIPAGMLDRNGRRGSTFVYEPGAAPERAVSVTMPVRLESWNTPLGVAPIFEMNLPEGALRERLRLAFAKATGTFDDLDLLSIVGRSQLGRVRFTGANDQLDEGVPFQSVDEILSSRRGGELYRYLIEKFATHSGISGVQPKFLVRDEGTFALDQKKGRTLTPSFRGATHIVKFWDPAEFPQLAANEFFCLKAAERCGLNVPPHKLAEDGSALVMERFDLRPDGTYRGFEDFCVLNARRTDEKYRGSYETSLMKRFQQFANSTTVLAESLQLFTLIALNCAIRNGDAHLKNFGIVYDDVKGEARLAPVYDLITTSIYIPQDCMALTLNGTNQWPAAKDLIRFGEGRSLGTRRKLVEILELIRESLEDTAKEISTYGKNHPEFTAISEQMIFQWEEGRKSIAVQRG
ncbi:MAG TPA: type II toxin-antitoxin system HipA family toxin [Terriglobales bacterium]|nr:type II toxin-antitoxin system HipA family toxin [Terriglobales bacterium]